MSDLCPTVRIAADNEQGFIVINEADFDPGKHTVWTEAKKGKGKADG